MADVKKLEALAKLIRYNILRMTTKAASGHATSSLSAVEVMTSLFFEKLRFDLKNPKNPLNDRVIFSKGHASPLLYALYAAAGVLTEKDLDGYRTVDSSLEGHPNPRFKYADVATGSLGQGLGIGLGMALALRAQIQNFPTVYVLMGDSECAEGSVWEALELASYYKVDNLVGIIDVNRLGQSTETLLGWDVDTYKKRVEAFGWQAIVVDGHDLGELGKVWSTLPIGKGKPVMIIAKTVKGKGVSFLEDKEGWHGKPLPQEDFEKAVKELGKVDFKVRGEIQSPQGPSFAKASEGKPVNSKGIKSIKSNLVAPYKIGEEVATRKAFGEALVALGKVIPNLVSLDAEVKNSTYSELFMEKFPKRFFEMFIAEQNMVSVASGMAVRGFVPFVSTFAAFFTRAFDQIRMGAYSNANVKFMGSHAGVSIGEDGPSQMGLQDIAMFRTIPDCVILYPGDGVAAFKLTQIAAENEGIFYIRTNRPATPVIYSQSEEFNVGGSKVLRSSERDKLTVVACGVTLIEAIKAADELEKEGINIRVIDAYCVKPIDEMGLRKAAIDNKLIITVEDHYPEGGLGDAVLNVFAGGGGVQVHKLAVYKQPRSGKSADLLDYEEISSKAIIKKVRELVASQIRK